MVLTAFGAGVGFDDHTAVPVGIFDMPPKEVTVGALMSVWVAIHADLMCYVFSTAPREMVNRFAEIALTQ